MSFFDIVVAFLLVAIPWIAGLRLVIWFAPKERRLPVLLGAAGGVGIGFFLMTLMALLRTVPVEWAVGMTFVAYSLLAVWAVVVVWQRDLTWDVSRGWTVLAIGLVSLMATGAAIHFASGIWNGATHENLVVRMAMTSQMARADWPPGDPYAPDFERLYRYTGQAWGAAVMRAGGVGLFEAILAITLVSFTAVVGAIFATVAAMRGYAAGFLGMVGFVTAAHANFLGIWKAPIGEYTVSRGEILAGLDRELIQGFTGSHGFFIVPGNDFTSLVGLAAGFGAAFLAVRFVRDRPTRFAAGGGAAVCLGAMGATGEHFLPIAVAGFGLTVAGFAGLRRWRSALMLAVVTVFGVALALVPQGALSAIVTASGTGQRATFGFTPENFLTLPTDAMLYSARTSPFFSVPLGETRVSLADPIVLKELPWVWLAFASGALLALIGRRRYLVPFIGAAGVGFLIPGLFSDQTYPINIARFTSVGVYLAGLLAGLVVAEMAGWRGRFRAAVRALAVVVAVLAIGSWVISIPLWPARIYETANVSLVEDLETADYLRAAPYGRRALVLPGPTTLADVISDEWEGQHKFVVTFGATSVPLGLDAYSAGAWYGSHYRRAYDTLESEAMQALGIDTVVVAPRLLGEARAALVAAAEANGRLTLEFTSSGGSRMVYTYVPGTRD